MKGLVNLGNISWAKRCDKNQYLCCRFFSWLPLPIIGRPDRNAPKVAPQTHHRPAPQTRTKDELTPRTLVSCEHVHALETQLTRDKRILRPEPGGSTWRAQSSILTRAVLVTRQSSTDAARATGPCGYMGESGTEDGRRRINTHLYKKYERCEPRAPPTVRAWLSTAPHRPTALRTASARADGTDTNDAPCCIAAPVAGRNDLSTTRGVASTSRLDAHAPPTSGSSETMPSAAKALSSSP